MGYITRLCPIIIVETMMMGIMIDIIIRHETLHILSSSHNSGNYDDGNNVYYYK